MTDWRSDGATEPVQVWCFLVLRGIPKDEDARRMHANLLSIGGLSVHNGIYAVVECARWSDDPRAKSMLFRRLTLEMASNTPGSTTTRRRFHLVDVSKLKEPLFVVPDIGCRNKRDYFSVKKRRDWIKAFTDGCLHKPFPMEYENDKAGLAFGLHDR